MRLDRFGQVIATSAFHPLFAEHTEQTGKVLVFAWSRGSTGQTV